MRKLPKNECFFFLAITLLWLCFALAVAFAAPQINIVPMGNEPVDSEPVILILDGFTEESDTLITDHTSNIGGLWSSGTGIISSNASITSVAAEGVSNIFGVEVGNPFGVAYSLDNYEAGYIP